MYVLPGRQPDPAVHALSRDIQARQELVAILNHLPYMALLLTAQRETVFANRTLLDTLGLENAEAVLTSRPGELLECIHSRTHAEGCGAAAGCRHCLASQVITDCLRRNQQVTREVRVSARVAGRLVAYDLKVTALPLALGGQVLAMVFLEDIGAQKRREHLESIFIHDLLNTVGSLQLFAELLQSDPELVRPAEFAKQVQLLTDEIRAQQILLEAERGNLERNILCVPGRELIEDTLEGISAWSARRGVTIATELPVGPVYLATDPLVARRVLLNAVKNAVEASARGETVKLGVSADPPWVAVTVWNTGAMAETTRHQVFQRSFSTKGQGRGLGTYSMRLLMENYLGGTVGFTSDPTAGTTFTLAFPSMQSHLTSLG